MLSEPGTFLFVLISSAVLALPASWILLRLYRRAVVRAMQGQGEAASRDAGGSGGVPTSPGRARIGREVADALPRRASGEWRRAMAAYAVGGVLFAGVMAMAFLVSSDTSLVPTRVVVLAINYAWPIVLTLRFTSGGGRPAATRAVVVYFAVCMTVWAVAVARNPDATLGSLVLLWVMTNVPPTVLAALFLWRRIRAVGPLVLAFMTAGITGANALVGVADSDEGLLRVAVEFGAALGMNAWGIFLGMLGVGFVLFGVLGWAGLGWLARRYEAKWLSDQSMTIDALWFYFGAVYAVGLTPMGLGWFAMGFVAFGVFVAAYRVVFRLWSVRPGGLARSPRLLLLRVFALGSRSERLFDAFGGWWRRAGSTCMIAGPDLATTTVEPHEFLRFVRGRVADLFIDSAGTLERRLAEIDDEPDFDGLHRVNEFFCHDNTWRLALERLAGSSDAVLMDLRGFSAGNSGCEYEVRELFNLVPLGRVVFVVDATTDEQFLRNTMTAGQAAMPADSPNRDGRGGQFRLVRLEGTSAQDVRRLMGDVTGAVGAG